MQPIEIIERQKLQNLTFKPLKSLDDVEVELHAEDVGMSNI
jgi:hypothetical protein